ncbi:MAG: COP23 domain-containing protein [Cyanobacteria bacterium J06623_7]
MTKSNYLAAMVLTSTVATLVPLTAGATSVEVTCEMQESVPTVIATFSARDVSQTTPILSFYSQYFDEGQGSQHCHSTASKLDTFYRQNRMNYLASDAVDGKPTVCAVERRGLSCDSHNSDVLFSVEQTTSPSELLYNMLGKDFKGSQLPSSRTVSRIYTDLRPLWWPF